MPGPDERVVVGERRLRLALGTLLIGLLAITALVFTSPAIGIAIVDERLDLIISTAATLGALAISALAWARYRVTNEGFAFAQAAAFLALGTVNGLVLMALVLDRGPELGFTLEDPGPMPVIAFVLARFIAAAMLVVGGIATLRRARLRPRWSVALVLAPALMTVALLAVLRRLDPPSPLTQQAIEHLQRVPREPLDLASLSPGLLGLQLVIGAMFLVAAWIAYRTTIRDDRPADAYLAIGLILAAFSQVHYALNPGSYLALVTTGDLLRVGFYAALLAGVIVQSRSDVSALLDANVELRRLREAEVNRALLEERGRLAREVHDGLAQDLWYARLKQGRLMGQLVDQEQRELAGDVMDAIDSGIADARQAVMAMRAGSTDAPLLDVVERYVADFADRYALDARFERDGDAPALPARTQAELLRIVQEALNNVRKHADATVVRVRTAVEGGTLEITVGDNGRGFDPGRTPDGYGLAGMRERAQLIGATVEIESEPSDGTCVRVKVRSTGTPE
ncbi:MAG TPA: sensor histidine kinase [Candidatus Angelobacter sp.]|nr:sensor histidine kinase [Candidatus Angelobacter sp.]